MCIFTQILIFPLCILKLPANWYFGISLFLVSIFILNKHARTHREVVLKAKRQQSKGRARSGSPCISACVCTRPRFPGPWLSFVDAFVSDGHTQPKPGDDHCLLWIRNPHIHQRSNTKFSTLEYQVTLPTAFCRFGDITDFLKDQVFPRSHGSQGLWLPDRCYLFFVAVPLVFLIKRLAFCFAVSVLACLCLLNSVRRGKWDQSRIRRKLKSLFVSPLRVYSF